MTQLLFLQVELTQVGVSRQGGVCRHIIGKQQLSVVAQSSLAVDRHFQVHAQQGFELPLCQHQCVLCLQQVGFRILDSYVSAYQIVFRHGALLILPLDVEVVFHGVVIALLEDYVGVVRQQHRIEALLHLIDHGELGGTGLLNG